MDHSSSTKPELNPLISSGAFAWKTQASPEKSPALRPISIQSVPIILPPQPQNRWLKANSPKPATRLNHSSMMLTIRCSTNSNIDFEQSRKVQIPTATDFFQSPNMFGCGTRQDQSGYTIWRTTLKAGRQELAGNST